MTFGLGGTIPASEINVGDGYYANIEVTDITLNGQLEVLLMYEFTPSAGDTFKIIDVIGTRTGSFLDVNEGDVVAKFGNIELRLSYLGGDGNDIVLTATDSSDFIFRNSFE